MVSLGTAAWQVLGVSLIHAMAAWVRLQKSLSISFVVGVAQPEVDDEGVVRVEE